VLRKIFAATVAALALVAASAHPAPAASWGTHAPVTAASWGTIVTPTAASWGTIVYVQDLSSTIPVEDVAAALPAFQTSVSRDLNASWGTDATLTMDPALATSANMEIDLVDSAACTMCLGFHDVINGKPTSFVTTGIAPNESWQLTFSHEMQEMLVDPYINHFANWSSRNWLVEVSDPCESGYYAYFIDGVAISDFITPRWYNPRLRGPFDFGRHFTHAGQIGRHGYASYLTSGGWKQVFG
jgi:hypothetical protein